MLKNQEDSYSEIVRMAKTDAAKKGEVFFLPLKLEDLMQIEFPENAWLINGLVPAAGITALSGQPRSFKTWVLLSIAKSISSGEPLFGEFTCQQTNVLIIDEESGLARIKRRLLQLDVEPDLPIYFWALQEFKIEDKYIDKLIEYCQEHNIELVIFDSLVRLHTKDENDAGKMAEVAGLLKRCTTQGITIIFAHHNRKPSNNSKNPDLASAMRGSSDILASVDTHIAITRDDKRLIITQTKSRDAEEIAPIELEITSSDTNVFIEYAGQLKRPESKADKARSLIIETISTQPNMNQKQLHKELNAAGVEIGIKTLRTLLKAMEAEGVLTRSKGLRNDNLYQMNLELNDE